MTEVDRLAAGKYVLVTSFRRDGTGVPTPVWVVRDGDELVIWSAAKAGKVKRIRRSGDVEVAACDFRGNASGVAVHGRARVLDGAGTERARRLIKAKYGVLGWATITGSLVRRGRDGSVGIAISLDG
ncbi:MAG TPA: PPOX class F420-dependent oxidoreductase [Actinophytocola sp.]|uniref:PPOX class F420-dependent oxidoreductase n=1 Tax=Actinophytocola sp. TaxID=1872138 RepID=UPI002DB67410|nr:PPOX class F420-dependent oxidoreductase [Actinophytocola sp.]HEU5474539.1 PPOX class F420-dependent oxidoreductase [Actinophytocola sp.]